MNLNATLVAQLVVFFILAWVTMKFVWPPIVKALDERAKKIADGLAAADKAKSDLAHAEKKVVEELRKARESATDVRASAEKQAAVFLDDARAEAARIIAQAREAAEAEAGIAAQRAKEALRDQVAQLAVAGAVCHEEIESVVMVSCNNHRLWCYPGGWAKVGGLCPLDRPVHRRNLNVLKNHFFHNAELSQGRCTRFLLWGTVLHPLNLKHYAPASGYMALGKEKGLRAFLR